MTCITRISNFLHLELRLASRLHLAFRVTSCISSYILRPELRLAFRVAFCVSSCILRLELRLASVTLIFRIFNAAQ